MSVELWTSAAFLEEAREWVAEQLATHDIRLTGEEEQPHARVWSSAIRYETTDGRVWFKVNGVGTAHEGALVRVIDERVPGLVPEVLAVDEKRAFSLHRDGGRVLRELAPADRLWEPWEGVVARYAEAQIVLSGHRAALLAAGIPEVSPATVPMQARALLDDLGSTPVADGGLTDQEVDAVCALLPQLDAWCGALAGSGVPESVQHDDLHSSNVCWSGSVETARVIDWGDATWGHPLGTMLATMNSVAYHAGLYVEGRPVDAPQVLRVRDAYLEPFTAYADRADLVRYVDLARRTGCVGKALSYRAATAGAPLSVQAEMEFPVREWFLGLLEG